MCSFNAWINIVNKILEFWISTQLISLCGIIICLLKWLIRRCPDGVNKHIVIKCSYLTVIFILRWNQSLQLTHLLENVFCELNPSDNTRNHHQFGTKRNLGECVTHIFCQRGWIREVSLLLGGQLFVKSSSFLEPPPPSLSSSFIQELVAPTFSQRLRAIERHMVRTPGLCPHKQPFSTKLCLFASSSCKANIRDAINELLFYMTN